MFKGRTNIIQLFLLAILLTFGFLYRIYGLNNNYSFWTDENPAAIFTRAILEKGKPVLANGYFTKDQQLQYWLNSISAKIFGLSEFGIRFPSVLFGTLTILATYLLGSLLFNRRIGYFASLLIAFLNIEILWSRQARPYQSLQFFLLLGLYFIYKSTRQKEFNRGCFFGFFACGVLASLMHSLGLVVFFSGFVYLLIFKTYWLKEKRVLPGLILFVVLGWILKDPLFSIFSQIGKINNIFYYRVFLTHNYLVLCLLAILGGMLLFWRKYYCELFLLVIPLVVQFIIVSFFLSQPFTRYFYPTFSFVLILASYGVMETGKRISEISKKPRIHYVISSIMIFVTVFSLWKTDKFSLQPKKIYSLNTDMQEIPEVDWKKTYNIVSQKLDENPEAVLLTNWNDIPVWYLGDGKLKYLIREELEKKDVLSGAYIINSLEKFQNLVKTQEKGIFVLDSWDNLVPDGVREYCQNNLILEFEVDRLYPIQPRYWTVWVYSWGIND